MIFEYFLHNCNNPYLCNICDHKGCKKCIFNSNFKVTKEEIKNMKLCGMEANELRERTKAMTNEEMEEIIRWIPSEILVKEVSNRFKKLDDLRNQLNSMYGTFSKIMTDGIDMTLADFSNR